MDTALPFSTSGGSFLRDYVNYARAICDAPEEYHVGVALALFGAAVADRIAIPRGPVPIPPMLWVILVGRSRHDRKTTAINIGTSIASKTALSQRLIQGTASAEGLQRLLAEYPTRLIAYPEFGRFLEDTTGGSYATKTRRLMMELADPIQGEFKHDLAKGTKTKITNPRLGVLGGCATTFLQYKTKREDWEGGFFGRSILIYARRDRNDKMQAPDPHVEESLTRRLEFITTAQIPRCGGFTRAADDMLHQWDKINDAKSTQTNDLVSTFYGGMCTTAWKLAMIYSLDRGFANQDGWLIDEASAYHAIMFCEHIWRPSFEKLAEKIVVDNDTVTLYRSEQVVESNGAAGASKSDIARATRLTEKRVTEAVNSLLLARRIYKAHRPDGTEVYLHETFKQE